MTSLRLRFHQRLNGWRNGRLLSRYDRPTDHPMLALTPEHARMAVLSRCFFLPRQSLYYARIPKNANSTISKTLASHSGVHRLDDKGRLAKAIFKRVPTPEQFEKARKVVFLRHPVERAVSAWRDKALSEKFIGRHQMAGDANTPPSFLQFLEALEVNRFYDNAHFLPQRHLVPGDPADYRMFVIEDLETGLAEVCEEVFGHFDGLSQRQTGRTLAKSYLEDVSLQETALLERLYAEDFELYASVSG